jgi:glycosyltransferase involved in cell wall biosynthesis
MLVANDLTIDTRVRKAASSVARAGFSVIAIGIDALGAAPAHEDLDGALLIRVVPDQSPKLSPRPVRLSRPELADAFRYRAAVRKARLHNSRRSLSADVAWAAASPPRWTGAVGRFASSTARLLLLPPELGRKIERRATLLLRRLDRAIRFGPRKSTTLLSQLLHQGSILGYRIMGRPSRPILRRPSWRRDLPELHRFEVAIGSTLDELAPDLIHVHDVFLLGVATRAKARAERAGRHVSVVYDAHEYVPGLPIDSRRRDAYTDLENEYVRRVDAIITVSEGLATLLHERFGIRPAVVMNAPDMEKTIEVEPVRNVAGVPKGSPLIIYVGGIAPHRGADVLIEAMGYLDSDVHLVFVSNSTTGYVADLVARGEILGLGDRLHVVPYVAPEAVVGYIRSADVSVVPLSREFMNYEIALPNKLFQSIQAGVPVVVSDNPEMERFVTRHHVGEVFTSGDVVALAKAVNTILESPERYAHALGDPELLELISWRRQAEIVIETYRQLGVEVR